MRRDTRVIRIDANIIKKVERKRHELQQQALKSGNKELWAFTIGGGLGAFVGYLIAKGLESFIIEKKEV